MRDAGVKPADLDGVILVGGSTRVPYVRSYVAKVFDREPLGWGASSRNGGMVIPELKSVPAGLERHYGELGTRLYAEANEAFDFVETTIAGDDGRAGIDCDYVRNGQLYLAHTPRLTAYLQSTAADHQRAGEPVHFVAGQHLHEERRSPEDVDVDNHAAPPQRRA